jgi:cholest-4-en-3-one 26-monooxygenase
MEARLFFTRLVERDIDLRVLGDPARLRSNFFRGIKTLPVALGRRDG